MGKLLLLILIFRILRWAIPYVVGVAAALLVLGYIKAPMSGPMALGLFLAVAIGLVCAIRPQKNSQNPPRHYRDRTDRRDRRR